MNDHPASKDDVLRGMQASGRDQMEDVLLSLHDNRVPRIRAAARPRHHIEMPREEIDDFPLSLVPPLRPDHCGDLPEAFEEFLHGNESSGFYRVVL